MAASTAVAETLATHVAGAVTISCQLSECDVATDVECVDDQGVVKFAVPAHGECCVCGVDAPVHIDVGVAADA